METESSEEVSTIISLKALACIQTLADYNTMKASGLVKGHKVHILIDSGSTYNFIGTFTTKQLGCEMFDYYYHMIVEVVNGEKIICDKMCAGLNWKMQWVEFKANLMVLPLEGCQIVLGIQWSILGI